MKLSYVEEDKAEGDSWHQVSAAANLSKDSVSQPDGLPCLKPANLNNASDSMVKPFSSSGEQNPEHKGSGKISSSSGEASPIVGDRYHCNSARVSRDALNHSLVRKEKDSGLDKLEEADDSSEKSNSEGESSESQGSDSKEDLVDTDADA